MQKCSLILSVLLVLSNGVTGQVFSLVMEDKGNSVVRRWVNDQPPRRDSLQWVMATNELISTLHTESYLLAKVDTLYFTEDVFHLDIDAGPVVHWAQMSFKANEFLPQHWVHELDISGERIKYNEWNATVRRVLAAAQADGYLFASYKLNVLGFENDSLKAEVVFEPGLQIVLDTIEVEGTARLSQNYLQKTVGIAKGEPVTPQDLETLHGHLDNLRFVQQYAPPVLILISNQATIRTYLNNRNASAFDVLAGLQPASGPDMPVSLTGYVELDLINQLTRGERIYLHLEKLRPRSQELELALGYPYLLDLPFGVEGDFRLLKNDTLYSELEWKGGISLPLGKNQYVRAAVTQQATNTISIDEGRVMATRRLPSYVDLRINGFTMGISRNRLDFDLNPRNGYLLVADATLNQRKVRENDLITSLSAVDTTFDYAALYDSLRETSTRISVEGSFQYFIPWGSRSTIRLGIDAGLLNSEANLFSNELFRLGGYERLRGFDEESILAQYFSIFTAEYRLIIGGASYISFFGDYAWIKTEDVEEPYEDRPFGFGFGLNFETQAGIFGMRVAVGSQRGNEIDFDATRIHLGYVNRF